MFDNYEWTALLLSVRWGHLEIVKCLCEAGADIHTRDIDGETAVTMAAFWGHLETLKYLAEAGADLNIRCQEKRWGDCSD